MKRQRSLLLAAFVIACVWSAQAQQSDYEITERFRRIYELLKRDIDSAQTKEHMAQLSVRINGLETEFGEHKKLIEGAFYPQTLESMVAELRNHYAVAQSKNTTIQEQSERISSLEKQIAILNTQIEGLNAERDMLLTKLRSAQTSLTEQRELIRRLNANLAAKDKLVNALVDSIFLPFGKNLDALSEGQKDALAQRLEEANVISRIADIARDNISFLSATKLESKDYAVLVNQYEQFKGRWFGLKERLTAAATANNISMGKASKGKPSVTTPSGHAEQVDAALVSWRTKLDESFWASLMNEFASRNLLVQPFNDGKSFSASIRSYVESAKNNSGENTRVFVEELWIQRIDKDWRSALESESMLGKLEYASLDRLVSQLHKERFNWQIVFWIANIIAVILVGWWFLARKPKSAQQQATATAKPNA